tara:strand:+ start:370 stop:1119 length:750 start_codon:yes stop_codon:yes gene_type:complete
MPRINNIGLDTDVTKDDKLLGSDSGGATKSYTLKNVSKFFKDSNAAGIAGQFTYQYKTSGLVSGTMGITFSSGSTFQNATSIKVSKFIYGETTNSSENILDILSSKEILIVDVEDQDNYAIYNSGAVTQDGSTDFYDISLTAPTKFNGSFTNEKIYAIISIGGGADKTDSINFSTSTFVDGNGNDQTETLSGITYFYFNFDHNLGKKPSITVTEAGSPDVKAFVPVKYINDNRVRVYFTGKTNGKVYAN